MALVLKDRVKETTTTTGTGTYTLAGAVAGFEAFSEIGNSNTTYYCCTDGTDFEVGIGTYTASGTTLARTTILQSSNSDAAVNWTSGTRTIFCTQPAEKAVFLNADGDIEFDNTHRIKINSNTSDPVLAIAGSGPNFIRFHDATGFTSTTNAVDIVYRTTPNDLLIERASGENIAEFGGDDGHAALYFNNSLKLETVSGGIDVTGQIAATSLDISGDVDVDGTLEADAMTLNGTAITTTATLSTGISNNNVPKFTSGVADNDFLRVNGTAIEGRSASEVLSDIGAATSAQGSTADSAMQDLSDDTSPTLGGALDTGGNQIKLNQTSGTAILTTGNLSQADLGILRAATGESGTHGFTIKYMGSRTGNNNSFSLFMDNQTGTDVEAITVLQDGKVGINNTAPTAPLDVTGNIVVSGTVDGRDLATDGTKLDGIEASADVTDTTNVTAAGALMDSEVTNLAQVKAFDSSDYATAAQGTTADAAMPKAGGTFTGDVTFTGDNYNIVFDKSDDALEFADNAKAVFGAGGDLQIYHDGSNSLIDDVGTGALAIRTNGNFIQLQTTTGEILGKFLNNGAVELYHDNSKKLETTADGINVSGDVLGVTSTDAGTGAAPSLQLYRNSASPADNDDVGQIQFHGENDAGEKVEYGRIDVQIDDASDGTEDAALDLVAMRSGNSTVYQRMAFSLNQFYQKIYLGANVDIQFEGDNYNAHETTLTVADPTADRTITLPDATGTVQLTDGSGASLTSLNASELSSGTVPNARLDAQLQDVAGLAVTNGNFIVGDGSNFVAESGATARTSLGLGTIATQAADSVNIDGGAVDGITLGTNSAVTEAQIDNININANDITSTNTNGNIKLTPNGTGNIQLNTDTVRVGDSNADATITTNGTGDLTLNTNSGTNSGSIVIPDGANGNISITPNGTGFVEIISTDDGAGEGPNLKLYRNSSSPADFDDLGRIYFQGNDDAGNRQDYAYIKADQYDVSDGSEDGALLYYARVGGSDVVHMQHAFGQTYVYGRLYLQNGSIHSNPHIQFEGSTANAHETTFNATDPTADRTITLPDASGTVQLTDGSGASLTSLNASELSSGTVPNARLDAQLQDVAGLAVTNGGFIVGDGSNFVLETGATARTSLGLGTAAVAATGISNGNVPVFTSGVADNDFLRVNGTSIEGRSASELASDIGASTTDEATALAIALG